MTYTGIQQTHNKCADSNQSSCMAFVTTNFPFFIAPIRCSWHSFNNKRCACVSPHFGNSLHIFISILILICNKWNVMKCCKINMKLRYVHICHWNIKMINNVMFRTKHAPRPNSFIAVTNVEMQFWLNVIFRMCTSRFHSNNFSPDATPWHCFCVRKWHMWWAMMSTFSREKNLEKC